MIVKALEIQEATQQAFHDETIMMMASAIYQNRNVVDDETMMRMLFEYSATLTSLTATLVSERLLSETEMSQMISEIKEYEEISQRIVGE